MSGAGYVVVTSVTGHELIQLIPQTLSPTTNADYYASIDTIISGGGGGGPFLPLTGGTISSLGNVGMELRPGSGRFDFIQSGNGNVFFTMSGPSNVWAFEDGNGQELLRLDSGSNQVKSQQQLTLVTQGTGAPVYSGAGETAFVPLYCSLAWTGAYTGGGPAFLGMYMSHNDSIAAGSGGAYLADIELHTGGHSATGFRSALNVKMSQTSTTGNLSGTAYVAGSFLAEMLTNDNGTAMTASSAITALNPVSHWGPDATFTTGGSGMEIDLNAEAGSNLVDKLGLLITFATTDAVAGTRDDIGIALDGSSSTVKFHTGLSFGRSGGTYAIAASGTMIFAEGTGGSGFTVANGLDWHLGTFTNSAIKTPGFTVDGTGNVSLGESGTSAASLKFFGTGSGSISLVPSTSASLGTNILTLPDVTGTLAVLGGPQTFTGPVLVGTGSVTGLPYEFQVAINADPSVSEAAARRNAFNTTLTYSTSSTNVWENLFSAVTINGPGVSTGEVNGMLVYGQFNTSSTIATWENFEASFENLGLISGIATMFLAIPHNAATGSVTGSIFGTKYQLQNDNAASGCINQYYAIDNEALTGSGSTPTIYGFIRNADPKGNIVSLGPMALGSLTPPVAGTLLEVVGGGTTSATTPFLVKSGGGLNVLYGDDSGTTHMGNGNAFVDVGGNFVGNSVTVGGSSTGELTFKNTVSGTLSIIVPMGTLSSNILTLPNFTDTFAVLGHTQTFNASQIFADGGAWSAAGINGSVIGASSRAAVSATTVSVSTSIALGLAGTSSGSAAFFNTTSGSITISPPISGALGTNTLTLPDLTDTFAVLGHAQTFSATQTFPDAGTWATTGISASHLRSQVFDTTASVAMNIGTTSASSIVIGSSGVALDALGGLIVGAAGSPTVTSGSGAPGSTQPNGSIYLRNDGTASTRLYVSEGGGTWSAIVSS